MKKSWINNIPFNKQYPGTILKTWNKRENVAFPQSWVWSIVLLVLITTRTSLLTVHISFRSIWENICLESVHKIKFFLNYSIYLTFFLNYNIYLTWFYICTPPSSIVILICLIIVITCTLSILRSTNSKVLYQTLLRASRVKNPPFFLSIW